MKTPRNSSFSTRSEPSKEVDELARKVIGAAIEVHRALGPGYIESVYEEALAYETSLNNIRFSRICREKVRIWGCERVYARSHPQIRVSTTEIPEEPNIPYERQVKVRVAYKGHYVGEGRLDLLVAKLLPVVLKAIEAFAPIHQAQLLSYLKMTGLQLGLLINFNVPLLKQGIKRVILST